MPLLENNPAIDLKKVPFSRFGSYFVFTLEPENHRFGAGVALKTIHQTNGEQELMRIELRDGENPVEYSIEASPASLTLRVDEKRAFHICIVEPTTIRFKSEGLHTIFHLNFFHTDIIKNAENIWRLIGWQQQLKLLVLPLLGSLKTNKEVDGKDGKGCSIILSPDFENQSEIVLEEFFSEWETRSHLESFENCVARTASDFERYFLGVPNVPEEYEETRKLAAYINWSNTVNPHGCVTRKATVMSNNLLSYIWNWDNLFNAMSLAPGQPVLSWEHIIAFYDNQSEDGQLPDYIVDRFVSYTRAKPPLQGWALRWMREHGNSVGSKQVEEIYDRLVKGTEWWFKFRSDDNKLPHYFFPSESGWDNSSALERGKPLLSPDLTSFLVLQMETIAAFAAHIGKPGEAIAWKRRSEDLLYKLRESLWNGECFSVNNSESLEPEPASESLLAYIPIILGSRLPLEVCQKLTEKLKDEKHFLCKFGITTESQSSSHFNADENWRGAVWPPATMFVVDGLRRTGEIQIAQEIAKRFCDNCVNNGFSPYYNSQTGEGLKDVSYTWSSSIFLMLASYYV